MKLTACVVLILLVRLQSFAFSDSILKTFDIKTPFGSIDNPSGGGGIVVLRNAQKNEWAVMWGEGSEGGIRTASFGRRVNDNGPVGKAKKINQFFSLTDAEYDSEKGTYIVLVHDFFAFTAQLYTSTLRRKGADQDLSRGFRQGETSDPQIVYDPGTKTYLLYVLFGENTNPLIANEVQVFHLDQTGKRVSDPITVLKAKNGRRFGFLTAYRNPVTGNTLLLVTESEENGPTTAARNLQAFVAKPDGKLLKQTPTKIVSSPPCGPINLIGEASYNISKTGVIAYSLLSCDGTFQETAFRRIKSTEKGLTPKKAFPKGLFIPNTGHAVAVSFDEHNNEFVIAWHDLGKLMAARINGSTGAIEVDPFTLATVTLSPNALIRDIGLSTDRVTGKTIAAWAEGTLQFEKYQIRGVLFEK